MKTTNVTIMAIGALTFLWVPCYAQKSAKTDAKPTEERSTFKENWRFELCADKETIRDTVTGLIWARDASIAGPMDWVQATEWVKTLKLGKAKDWWLPTIEELATIAESVPFVRGVNAFNMSDEESDSIETVAGVCVAGNLNAQGFKGVKARNYWSSTPGTNDKPGYRTVHMTNAFQFHPEAGNRKNFVWPVRSEKANVNGRDNNVTSPLHDAVAEDQVDKVKSLLTNKAKIDAKDNDGDTPLHFAVAKGQKDTVQMLLAHKADVNARNNEGYTPLLMAAEQGSLEVVEMLLANKADINVRQNNGYTPLHNAVKNGHKNVVKLLLANKETLDARAYQGETPLFIASAVGKMEIVELLVANKADVNAMINKGYTPMSIAKQQRHDAVAEFLSQHGGRMETDQKSYLVRYCVAIARRHQGHLDGTISSLIHKELGEALKSDGKYDDAVLHLKLALAISPKDVEAHDLLGATYGLQKNFTDAVDQFRICIQMNPKNGEYYMELGMALCLGGKMKEGIAEIKAARKLKPDDKRIEEVLEAFEKLQTEGGNK